MATFRAVLIAVVIVGLIGFLLERGLFQFTLTRPNNGFMASLGLSIVLQHVVIRIWNSFSKSIPEPLSGVWQIGEIRFIKMRVVVVLVTALVVAVTFFTISRSRYGLALRASLADRQTAALMGIPIRRYITVVFTYGSAIAGLGGALTIALFPVTPFVGSEMIMLGFAVALIAGLGNVARRRRRRSHPRLGQRVQRCLRHAGMDERLYLRTHDRDPDLPAARFVWRHHGAGD